MIEFFIIQKAKSDLSFSRHSYSKREIIADFRVFDTDYTSKTLLFLQIFIVLIDVQFVHFCRKIADVSLNRLKLACMSCCFHF